MLKKLLIAIAFVFAAQFAAPDEAAAQSCGGPGEVPCYVWSWCAYTTPSIFGDVCWGGLVPNTPWAGCDNNRLNNWGLVCVPCGSPFEPTCAFGPVCDADRRFTAFGLCYPCGQTGEAVCTSGPSCDVGNRAVFGFCSYSGFSNEPTTNVATMPVLAQPGSGAVRGIADLHTHQFSNLGFGGAVFWGAPYDARGINSALPWCDYTWEFSIYNEALNLPAPVVPFLGYEAHGPKALQALTHIVSNGIPEGQHEVGGTGPFDGWPDHNTYTHQQMYHKWVERAFQGGLRLMVLHMVSNEALCSGSKRRSDFTCNDMDAVDKQIQAAKDLERAIDRMDDNTVNGTGWYRIAYSPAQARQLIRAGKMAVVLGIEVDSLFNCKPGVTCTRAFLRSELQRYYNMGIRHVFPIHQFDNAFGGAALFRDELNAGNAIVTGNHFTVQDCSAAGYTYNVDFNPAADIFSLVLLGVPPPNPADYAGSAADCNSRGLTAKGIELIEEMIDLKFIIDVDHMSRDMKTAVLDIAKTTTTERPNKYPLVSSHTSFHDLSTTDKSEYSMTAADLATMKEIGGMITAPNPRGDCSSTRDYRQNYDFAVNAMKRSDTDPFAPVGFSTDANGFGGSTDGRFNPNCGPDTDVLAYPFTGVMGGTFNRQVTGDRTFDFNTQGVAQYGLLADFFADLKRVGFSDADLDPLLNSAESYIRMWEAIDNSDRLPPPTITANVAGTQGNNNWYRSDVVVTWEIEAAEGIIPVLTGCGEQSVTSDTAGVTFTCSAQNPGTGEHATASVTIRRDATPPNATSTRISAVPASGWTNQNVTVRFNGSDTLSGMGSATQVDVLMTQEGENQIAAHTFFDQAGNFTVAQLGNISIDKTRPDIGFRFAHLAENATPAEMLIEQLRWHNQAVTLLVDARDTLSGIQSVTQTQVVFSVEGVNLTTTVGAVDRAGNSVIDTSDPIRIDLTAPIATFQSRTPANARGWNRADVTVSWTCADALSGVAAALVSQTVSTEGADQTATQNCVDNAGNNGPGSVAGVNIDKTAPVVEYGAQQPPANTNGWNNTPVAIPFNATDSLSGVFTVTKAGTGSDAISPLLLNTEGGGVGGAITVTDRADNEASYASPLVNVDMTPPSIAFVERLPLANAAGWNNSDITIRWACADGLSGIVAANTAETLSTEGANQSLTGRCVDRADNVSTDTQGGLQLDKTAPLISCSASPNILWPPNSKMIAIQVQMTFTDALAGTQGFSLISTTSNEPGLGDIAGFTLGAPDLAGELRAQREGGGNGRLYTLAYRGVDLAGNTADCSAPVRAPHDLSDQQQ